MPSPSTYAIFDSGDGYDLNAAKQNWHFACYAGVEDDRGVDIGEDWITTPFYRIRVFTPVGPSEVGISQRHQGKWDSGGAYTFTGGPGQNNILVKADYVTLDGLQVDALGQIGISTYPFSFNGEVIVRNNIVRLTDEGNSDTMGIRVTSTQPTAIAYIYNNLVYKVLPSATVGACYQLRGSNLVAYVYNNTAARCGGQGFEAVFATVTVKNNIAQETGRNAFDGTGTFQPGSDYNISDDATGSGGPNDQINATVSFIDPVLNDFHLSPVDAVAQSRGLNLSSDPALVVLTDIDGQTRSVPWDMGADQAN